MIFKKNSIDTGKYFCLQNFACLKVAGKDAKVFLQNLIANDIELLEKNECLTSVITNTLGKVKFLVFIQKMGTDYLLFCELERIKKLQEHLEFFHIIEDVLFVNEILTKNYKSFFIFYRIFSYYRMVIDCFFFIKG